MAPPREIFTVATRAHQDANDPDSQRQYAQDSQTLLGPPPHPSTPTQFYAPQQPALGPPTTLPGTHTPSFPQPQDSKDVYPSVSQRPPIDTSQASNRSPPGTLEQSPAPPYTLPSPVVGKTDMQPQFDPNYNPGVARPAPAYGHPSQQLYPQPQPQMQAVQPGLVPQVMQPAPVPGMDIRNVKGIPRDGNGERDWSHGCSECFDDCGTCMLGWCCPCMLYSQIQTRLNHIETRGLPHPTGGDSCAGDCFVHCLLNCWSLGWVLQIGQRQSVRMRYRIVGDGCSDCMMAYCCSPCEMTQVSREIELEEQALGGAPTTIMQPPNPYPEKQ